MTTKLNRVLTSGSQENIQNANNNVVNNFLFFFTTLFLDEQEKCASLILFSIAALGVCDQYRSY